MNRRPGKFAFIHYAKAAGRFVNHYLCGHVFRNTRAGLPRQEYKVFNSWQRPYSLGRDWTEDELIQLASNRFPDQFPTPEQIVTHRRLWSHDYLARQYVHNHHRSWNENTVREFRRNGWLTFMFIRDPAELLCSLWSWARDMVKEGADPGRLIRPPELVELSLDDFFREVLRKPAYTGFYGLPAYTEEIEFIAEFTDENFDRFLRQYLDHEYRPDGVDAQYKWASTNPGYAAYRQQGLISDETHRMFESAPEVRRIRERLGPTG